MTQSGRRAEGTLIFPRCSVNNDDLSSTESAACCCEKLRQGRWNVMKNRLLAAAKMCFFTSMKLLRLPVFAQWRVWYRNWLPPRRGYNQITHSCFIPFWWSKQRPNSPSIQFEVMVLSGATCTSVEISSETRQLFSPFSLWRWNHFFRKPV